MAPLQNGELTDAVAAANVWSYDGQAAEGNGNAEAAFACLAVSTVNERVPIRRATGSPGFTAYEMRINEGERERESVVLRERRRRVGSVFKGESERERESRKFLREGRTSVGKGLFPLGLQVSALDSARSDIGSRSFLRRGMSFSKLKQRLGEGESG